MRGRSRRLEPGRPRSPGARGRRSAGRSRRSRRVVPPPKVPRAGPAGRRSAAGADAPAPGRSRWASRHGRRSPAWPRASPSSCCESGWQRHQSGVAPPQRMGRPEGGRHSAVRSPRAPPPRESGEPPARGRVRRGARSRRWPGSLRPARGRRRRPTRRSWPPGRAWQRCAGCWSVGAPRPSAGAAPRRRPGRRGRGSVLRLSHRDGSPPAGRAPPALRFPSYGFSQRGWPIRRRGGPQQ